MTLLVKNAMQLKTLDKYTNQAYLTITIAQTALGEGCNKSLIGHGLAGYKRRYYLVSYLRYFTGKNYVI